MKDEAIKELTEVCAKHNLFYGLVKNDSEPFAMNIVDNDPAKIREMLDCQQGWVKIQCQMAMMNQAGMN